MAVVLIAILHAIPVLIAANWLQSRVAVYIVAAVMTVVGFATGGPAYGFADFLAVVGSVWIGLNMISEARANTKTLDHQAVSQRCAIPNDSVERVATPRGHEMHTNSHSGVPTYPWYVPVMKYTIVALLLLVICLVTVIVAQRASATGEPWLGVDAPPLVPSANDTQSSSQVEEVVSDSPISPLSPLAVQAQEPFVDDVTKNVISTSGPQSIYHDPNLTQAEPVKGFWPPSNGRIIEPVPTAADSPGEGFYPPEEDQGQRGKGFDGS